MDEDVASSAYGAGSRQVDRKEPPATDKMMVVPVIRDARFSQLRPDQLTVMRSLSGQAGRYELRLQSFVYRETSQRINLAGGGDLGVAGRDVCMEVLELGTVDLTLEQMCKLRDDLDREINGVGPGAFAAPVSAAALNAPWPGSAAGRAADFQRAAEMMRLGELRPNPPPGAPQTDAPAAGPAPGQAGPGQPGAATPPPGPAWPNPAAAAIPPRSFLDELSGDPFSRQRRRAGWYGTVAIASIVLAAVGLLAWVADPDLADALLPSRPNPLASFAEAQAASGAARPVNDDRLVAASLTPDEAPAPVAADPAVLVAATATPPPRPAPEQTDAPAAMPAAPTVSQAAAPAADNVATSAVTLPHLAITVRASCWIIVSDGTGTVYLEKLMKSGDTWPVPPLPGLELRTGNAGATSFVVDGVTEPPLGADNTLWTGQIKS